MKIIRFLISPEGIFVMIINLLIVVGVVASIYRWGKDDEYVYLDSVRVVSVEGDTVIIKTEGSVCYILKPIK